MDVVSTRPERAHSVDFVDGRTRLYGILGHPIEQVRSPQTVTFELRRRGVNAILVPLHILPEDFDEVFPRLLRLANLDGLVVTVPHKSAACRLLDRVGPLASFSGGVSVIARSSDDQWIGEMFDGSGCVRAMSKRGVRLQGQHVLLLGAGGAGSAIAAAIARQGPGRITLQEPDRDRRQALMHKIAGNFPDISLSDETPPLEQVDVLVNASPVGMLDETRMPIDADRIPQHVVVMDAIMDPDRTKLLGVAEESRCVTVYGREMLDAQIAGVCDFLLGARQERADRIGFDY